MLSTKDKDCIKHGVVKHMRKPCRTRGCLFCVKYELEEIVKKILKEWKGEAGLVWLGTDYPAEGAERPLEVLQHLLPKHHPLHWALWFGEHVRGAKTGERAAILGVVDPKDLIYFSHRGGASKMETVDGEEAKKVVLRALLSLPEIVAAAIEAKDAQALIRLEWALAPNVHRRGANKPGQERFPWPGPDEIKEARSARFHGKDEPETCDVPVVGPDGRIHECGERLKTVWRHAETGQILWSGRKTEPRWDEITRAIDRAEACSSCHARAGDSCLRREEACHSP